MPMSQHQIDDRAFQIADQLHPKGDNDPHWEPAYNAARAAIMSLVPA